MFKSILATGVASLLLLNSFAQNYDRLIRLLTMELAKDSLKDGRWVLYRDEMNIRQIEKPLIRRILPHYSFYSVTLTNFLGWHVNTSDCLIMMNEKKSKVTLFEPVWYTHDDDLLRLFIGKKFADSTQLLGFLKELEALWLVGTAGRFENWRYEKHKVSFEHVMIYPVRKESWRKIRVDIKDNIIRSFVSLNPATGDIDLVK